MSTDNPSAFPTGHIADFHFTDYEPGMSLRDWQWTQFAAAAIQGYLSNKGAYVAIAEVAKDRGLEPQDGMAGSSIEIADAMMAAIAERAKPTPIPSTLEPRTRMT